MASGHVRYGAGQPIVLLHGGGSSWREFDPLVPGLEPSRDVVVIKTPGHHEAPLLPAGAPVTVAAIVDRIELELDALGLRQSDVVGHSFGGWHALELARRGRAHSVIAIAPAGGWTQQEAARTEHMFAKRFIPTARHMRRVIPILARTRAGRRVLFAETGARGRHITPETAVAFMTALAEWPLAPRIHEFLADADGRYRTADDLHEIRCPVLLLWGTNDKIVPLHQADHFLHQRAAMQLTELPGAGHFPHFDVPDTIVRAILEFTEQPAG